MSLYRGTRRSSPRSPPTSEVRRRRSRRRSSRSGSPSLVVVALGVVFSQVNYALSDRVLTQSCIEQQISPEDNGAIGVCNIVEALDGPAHDRIALPGDRARGPRAGPRPRHLPADGFRSGGGTTRSPARSSGSQGDPPGDRHPVVPVGEPRAVRQALPQLRGSRGLRRRVRPRGPEHPDPRVRRGARRHRDRPRPGRARRSRSGERSGPQRAIYINFFRGTPLIWQLVAGYFLLLFGFGIRSVGVRRRRSSCSR